MRVYNFTELSQSQFRKILGGNCNPIDLKQENWIYLENYLDELNILVMYTGEKFQGKNRGFLNLLQRNIREQFSIMFKKDILLVGVKFRIKIVYKMEFGMKQVEISIWKTQLGNQILYQIFQIQIREYNLEEKKEWIMD